MTLLTTIGSQKREIAVALLAVALFCIDRIAKASALSGAEAFASDSWLHFILFRNTGIAFSFPLPMPIFWGLAAIAFAGLVVSLVRMFRTKPLAAAFLVMIILGGISNVVDRVFYGATIDYLIFFRVSAVNIADGMIIAGLIGVFVCELRATRNNNEVTPV